MLCGDGEFLSSLSSAIGEYFSSPDGFASFPESVSTFPFQFFRLVGSFHIFNKKYSQCTKRKEKVKRASIVHKLYTDHFYKRHGCGVVWRSI